MAGVLQIVADPNKNPDLVDLCGRGLIIVGLSGLCGGIHSL